MSPLRIEWDPEKNEANRRKHGVTFVEAASVFADDYALLIPDAEHSREEERFVLVGLSAELRVLVVCHCDRESEQVIRIISARRATRRERGIYNQRWTR